MTSKKRVTAWLLVICLVLTLCSGNLKQVSAAENGKIRVTCVGDSITEGYMASDGNHTYPAQLQKVLGNEYEVVNVGVSGTTVTKSDDRAYTKTGRYQDGLKSNPDIVIIMLGTNDTYINGINQNQGKNAFRKDYASLIEAYQNCGSNPKIMLAYPISSVDENNKHDQRDSINEDILIPIIKDLAKEYGLTVLDTHNFTGTWTRNELSDGLHPNDNGYERLARFFANAVIGHEKGFAGYINENANYQITSKASGLAMMIEGHSRENEAKVIQTLPNGYASQSFSIHSTGDGYYQIINVSTNKALNVPGRSVEAGTKIIQYNTGKDDNEKWLFEPIGDGNWRITPKMSPQMGLNVEGGSYYSGANIIQWNYNGDANEQWKLYYVDKVNQNPNDQKADVVAVRQAYDAYVAKFKKAGNYNKFGLVNADGFWSMAETAEVFIDAYERFGDTTTKQNMIDIVESWLSAEGDDWWWNGYNDDIMWAVIMLTRTYLDTGEEKYLNIAKKNYKMSYDRAWTEQYGGGLVWCQDADKTSKNACVNGPGAIASCYLAIATGDNSYYDKAAAMISWMNKMLVQSDGSVWDSIDEQNGSYKYNTWVSTYNQGTYIGACTMLYEYNHNVDYLNMAKKAADRATKLGNPINVEQNGADLIGFKGILARWLGKMVRDLDINDYNEWMQSNADSAWKNRNSDNLMWTQFGNKTQDGIENSMNNVDGGAGNDYNNSISRFASWGCSSALSWLLNCADWNNVQQLDGFYRIKSAYSGMYLDNYGTNANGDPINLFSRSQSYNQQWQIISTGDGYFKIINRTSGKALDNASSLNENEKVIQWEDNGGNAQRWRIVKQENGNYRLISRYSRKTIDSNWATKAGISASQWTDKANQSQQWILEPVEK